MSLRLTVSNIGKTYDGKPVLKDCSFSFDSSGIYVLMGPNGSGKSTFLRICALLERPDTGEVNFFSGSNIVRKDTELRRRISLVLPKIGLFNTTVFKNVAYGLKIRGMKKKEIEERVNKALELVGLIHKKSHTALTLSSGETQRVGIARAIVIEPDVLFLDEPTASLDPHSTTIIEETITKIKQYNRLTIIMVTHNIFQAKRLAESVLFMYEGRIIDHGSKMDFFEKPRNERVYKFITGQMVY
jgi:tungstate transport system ATP-binding protein